MALSEENFKLFFKATGILENDTKPQEKKKELMDFMVVRYEHVLKLQCFPEIFKSMQAP